MNERPEPNVEATEAHVRVVAELIPFPVDLWADMGARGSSEGIEYAAAQIDLGSPSGDAENADRHMAAIAGRPGERWYFTTDESVGDLVWSDYTIDSDPAAVADWIAKQARLHNSPAAVRAFDRADIDQRVGLAADDQINRHTHQAEIDGATSALTRARSDAKQALATLTTAANTLPETDPGRAAAALRYRAALATLDAARARLARAHITRSQARALHVAEAWNAEATALIQGNPYDATSAKGKTWAIGYNDALDDQYDGMIDPYGPDAAPYRAGHKAGRERAHAPA